MMAKALAAQSNIVPALFTYGPPSKEYSKRSVKMTCCSLRTTPGLRISSFSGLNCLDNMVRFGHDFRSKVALTNRGRGSSRCVPKAMFERYSDKAIKVVKLSHEEAKRLGHNFVGTEQILLGLIGEGTGIASIVLKSMGINLKDARVQVEKIIGRGDTDGFVAADIRFTPLAKRLLQELSFEEARLLGNYYIESEHLLLGLLRECEGVAACVLKKLGADPINIRKQVKYLKTLEEEYGTDLTKLAQEGKLQILGRRTKNNKSSDVPDTIEEGEKVHASFKVTYSNKRIKIIDVPDMGLVVAGTKYRGEFEERLKKLLMEEIGAEEDAFHAANILKTALARDDLQVICFLKW